MIYRSVSPLRIGLAGGGTDVSPYSDEYGGAILNATISLYAHSNIEMIEGNKSFFCAADKNEVECFDTAKQYPINSTLDILKGVYNKLQQDYDLPIKSFKLTTFVDAPAGSGLGTSSTLTVSVLGAFIEMYNLPLGEYEIAQYAYEIERNYLKLAGGKQDQYATTFGGVNYMEFYEDNKVIVNPLKIKENYLDEIENNLVLYFTNTSRESAKIIVEQQKNVQQKNISSIEAMHQLKAQAKQMKEALLKGELNLIGEILDFGFQQKKKMAGNISNQLIEEVYEATKKAGALGGKISGAGGGGFMFFYCPKNYRYPVIEALKKFGGKIQNFKFTNQGLKTWKTK